MKKITELIMVRHAKVNYTPDDRKRALSKEGENQRQDVLNILKKKEIDLIYSSPFKRAIDTIKPYADFKGMEINIIENLRERKISDVFIDDFDSFANNQWKDFDYKLNKGESLREVRERGLKSIESIIRDNRGKRIVIGTHGTFLGVMLNHYEKKCDYRFWRKIKMPAIISIKYNENDEVISIVETEMNGNTIVIK
ncbi:histidine phosphatase family protein [Clostridium sp. D2Q-11]|uniref:Histidine phosphatase family protein n=1 Tax=Anaeromonas frigoriresistens TaxID=2683708 RepID=A0A942Z935_9FIRM|nr:histidine phosphatase family protein [Anaeromonas frigoriresistens]MBS4538913.1 histidine phosphatase family protein [Anaeromonas frigoriresistens]